ncbi:hypothetical protein BDP55DRAFT_631304 [Colletotrichum godetiae]|uniref:Uncharacterized protein n=1 Tax=Colletotrichum godetiae TaxID=1209918 RepID=A0AAJ0EUF7_9PEZI|nr:uncharacterized protein BDP55DRAFT_631304 [Colletotrichum godetiae]KAK1676132.1 hypothetical protein BDP55DRAFT_631304 [Colletotrichum godetiae]
MGSQSSGEMLYCHSGENASFFPSNGRIVTEYSVLPLCTQRKPRSWAAWDGTWTGHTDAKLLGRADEWSRTTVNGMQKGPVQIDRELSRTRQLQLTQHDVKAPTNGTGKVTVAQHASYHGTLIDKAHYLLYRVIKHLVLIDTVPKVLRTPLANVCG